MPQRTTTVMTSTHCHHQRWLLWSMYVFFSMSPDAVQNVDLVSFADAEAIPLREFNVTDAHCYGKEDEAKLRSIIESEGASDFNQMIREVAEQLVHEEES